MHQIENNEKHMPAKRKSLLIKLREHNWKVLGVDDKDSDWALDEKWLIESTKENQGFTLELWLFKYDGKHDGMDRVVAKTVDSPDPGPYSGTPSIELDGRKFEKQLKLFMESLHKFRINAS
jgi:hypothetical protein